MSTFTFAVLFVLTCIGISACVVGIIACVHGLVSKPLTVKRNRHWKKRTNYTKMSEEVISRINDRLYNQYCQEKG